MVHDRALLDQLAAFTPIRFDAPAFRATRIGLDALTPSLAGGRWAPRDVTPVLYTSLEREGALAEISFHLSLLDPKPSKPVMLHRMYATARATIRLLRADLVSLGVDWDDYHSVGYNRTQEIGAAIAFLECDGLLAPSARWPCDNLMLFMSNHALADKLELESSEPVNWVAWLDANRPPATS